MLLRDDTGGRVAAPFCGKSCTGRGMERPADKSGPRTWATVLALVVAGIALLALIGWPLGERRLVALFAGNAAMKFNQAIGLLLLAVAVIVRARLRRGRLPSRIAASLAL